MKLESLSAINGMRIKSCIHQAAFLCDWNKEPDDRVHAYAVVVALDPVHDVQQTWAQMS